MEAAMIETTAVRQALDRVQEARTHCRPETVERLEADLSESIDVALKDLVARLAGEHAWRASGNAPDEDVVELQARLRWLAAVAADEEMPRKLHEIHCWLGHAQDAEMIVCDAA